MNYNGIEIVPGLLADFCRNHQIRRLSLFGSILRNDFRPDSDVDLLVEFTPNAKIGWNIIDIEEECSRFFGGRKVQMLNPKYLNRRLKKEILSSAQQIYEDSHAQG
jgi:predicted nucleotidyltransferase